MKKYYRVKDERNALQKTTRRKALWDGHVLRRNWLPKHVIEQNIEEKIGVTRR
jgi:hypothetical protein